MRRKWTRVTDLIGWDRSGRLPDVVAGFSEFGYDFFGVVMAAGFQVELDTADLDRVFGVQAVVKDVEDVRFLLGDDAHELPQGTRHIQKIHFNSK